MIYINLKRKSKASIITFVGDTIGSLDIFSYSLVLISKKSYRNSF